MKKLLATSLVAAAMSTGCASIVTGETQVVNINSNVPEAEVLVNGVAVGKTPFNGAIKKGKTTAVTVRKTGYQERTVQLATELEGAFWGNIVIGGVLGSSTDYGTGNMYRYAPNTIQVDLEKTPGN